MANVDVVNLNGEKVGSLALAGIRKSFGTNLVLGASFTACVGTLLEAAYNWLPNPIVPVQITIQVTDQPVVEDFGVRLVGDVGLRRVSWFFPSVRVSYQARDYDHTGFSGGFAFCAFALEVVAGFGVHSGLDDGDAMQGGVHLPVAAAV